MRKRTSPGAPSLASPSSPAPGTPIQPLNGGNEFDGGVEDAITHRGGIAHKATSPKSLAGFRGSRNVAHRPVETTTHRTADGEALLRPETWQGTYP